MSLQHHTSCQRAHINPCVQHQHFFHDSPEGSIIDQVIPFRGHASFRTQGSGPPTSHTWKIWCIVSSQQRDLELQSLTSNFRCRTPLQILRPSTLALCFRCSGSLQVRPKDYNFALDLVRRYYFPIYIFVINVG